MGIKFTSEDWARIGETYYKWWSKELDRPVIKLTLQKEYSYSGNIPLLAQDNCHRLDISAEDVVERINLDLENQEYYGDAFPMFNFDVFGPGLVGAFLGAELDNSTGKVWLAFPEKLELKDMHFEYQKDNVWLNRIKDIYNAAHKKWKGNVLMGMPDLGGVMDILSCVRGANDLLLDLYDEPDEVKRVSKEIQDLWIRYYRELEEVLQPVNPGYSDWSGLYSSQPSYVVQDDFAYMIGPDMFEEFVVDDLTNLCNTMTNTLYHLDGKGQLNHLPQLMAIESLGAIQWCPGDMAPSCKEWMDVYRSIRKSGKNMQILGDETDFAAIAKEIGAKGLYQGFTRPYAQKERMLRHMEQYGVR